MARVALDSLLLGLDGQIHAGDEIPETFTTCSGEQEAVDFDRLEALGLVEPVKRKTPSKAA